MYYFGMVRGILVQIVSTSVMFLSFAALWALHASPVYRVIKCCGMYFSGSLVSSSAVFSYLRTTYFRDGTDPVCCAMWSTVYLRPAVVGPLYILRLIDGNGGTSEAKSARGV